MYGYPFPGTYIVDTRGVVTSRFFEEAYQERDTVSSILVRLGQHVGVRATKIDGGPRHGDLICDRRGGRSRNAFLTGAGRHTRTACARLRPGRARLQAGDDQRRTAARAPGEDPALPQSEDYFFKPLNEHVPVYQRAFRIMQDVTLDPSREGTAALKDVTSLTIKGRFEYQACDDRVCFTPQSVPLAWTIGVKPLDRERPKPQ